MNNQYMDVFLEEAKEHIDSLNDHLLKLERNPTQEIIDEIFRSAHTLKGMSGTMGYNQLSELTHEMENLLQEIRSHQIEVNAEIIDTLLRCVDILEEFIGDIAEHGEETERDIYTIISRLKTKNLYSQKDVTEKTVHQQSKSYDFNEYEDRIIYQALREGLFIWEIVIKLVDDCLLKSARAFLVFKTLEAFSEIIKTRPEVQDIEDEKFDTEFTLYLVTKYNKDKILESLDTISEIETIEINEINEDSLNNINAITNQDNRGSSKSATKNQISAKRMTKIRKTNKTLRVDIDRLDILMNLVSELIIIKTRLYDLDGKTNQNVQREAVEYLERITSNLHDAVMKARMVPIETVFKRFPRVVHDLSRELSKNIDLIIEGAETELDRTIIDEIGDPLIHLIRNAADHGIENPTERISKGKPENGNIKLKAYHDGNNVVIEVSDDGIGIDINDVLKKSVECGLVEKSQADNLKDYEITSFLFEPGFSTKGNVTDVSGRGVGLDVVKTKIESLGGSIEINNKQDIGTTFLIRLPLTLAIIQALMVQLGNEKYAVPLNTIKETVIIPTTEIKKIQKSEVIVLRGKVIPVIRLNKLLDIDSNDNKFTELTMVIVKKGEKDFGLVVDSLIGQQEIVIKTLGNLLKNIKFIAGATILGDGQVALILDVNNLL